MKRFRFIAATLFAVLLLTGGCTGRRSPGKAGGGVVSGNGTPETGVPEPPSAVMPDTAVRTEISRDGSCKRWGPFVENDTTFLFVHEYPLGGDTNRFKVFIRKGPQPGNIPNLNGLSPQNVTRWKDFTDQLRTIKKNHPEPLPRHAALEGLPRSWTPIRIFRGNCYVDGFNPYPVWISDSLFIRETMDGPYPSLIDTAERITPTHYRLRTATRSGGIDRVDIRIVDTVRRIALFSLGNAENPLRSHSLYVPFETAREMDMVDFDSLELPEDEVAWDEIDFEALISGAAALPDSNPKTAQTNNE